MSRPSLVAAARAVALPTAAVSFAAAAGLRLSGRAPVLASAPLSVVPWMVPAAGVLSALAEVRGHRASAVVLAGSASALAAAVAPRFVRTPQPDVGPGAARLTVMSSNVYKGSADPQILLNHLRARHPDILAVQEQSPGYVRALVAAGIEDVLPYRQVSSGSRLNDAAIFSKHPLEPFPTELPSVFVGATVVLPTGVRVPFISAHPLPPATPARERHWKASLRLLPDPRGDLAVAMVAGDFNATLDHPDFRSLLRRGWRDVGAELGAGGRSTWSGTPFFDALHLGLMRMTIDHVLVPPGARVLSYRVDRLHGSDHRLLTTSVELPARSAFG